MIRSVLPILTFALLLPAASHAVTLVVPDDVPTIQAAIDAEPETVLVRSGTYAERPVIQKDLVLIGTGPTAPRTQGLRILIPDQQDQIIVDGFHFDGLVRLDTFDEETESFAFRRCVMDSGFAQWFSDVYDVTGLEVTDCRIRGGFDAFSYHRIRFERNVVEGPVRLRSSGYVEQLSVHDNDVRSTGSTFQTGLEVDGDMIVGGDVSGNRVTGFGNGIVVRYGENLLVRENRVEDCDGIGLTVATWHGVVEDNVVLRCGVGMQFDLEGDVTVRRNVVGRSVRDGVEIWANHGAMRVTNNTIYSCGGSGIDLLFVSPHVDSLLVDHNVGYANGAFGIEGVVPDAVTLECNDWFANAAGSVSGGSPGATDLEVDPMFCNLAADDVGLQTDSPLAAAAGCGLIGARPVACATVSVDPQSIAARFELAPIAPNPARGSVEFRFHLPRAASIELDVVDVLGRRVATLTRGEHAAGAHHVRWTGRGSGVYFARLRHAEGTETRKFLTID